MWDIINRRQEDGTTKVAIRIPERNSTMAIITIPEKIDMPLSVIYKDAKKDGKPSMVECDVHRIYKNVPMWTFQTTYGVGDDKHIVYRIYNETHVKFTIHLFNDGTMRASCPTKIRRVPLDENGKPIRNEQPPKIIPVAPKEEFPEFKSVIEKAEEVKVRTSA